MSNCHFSPHDIDCAHAGERVREVNAPHRKDCLQRSRLACRWLLSQTTGKLECCWHLAPQFTTEEA